MAPNDEAEPARASGIKHGQTCYLQVPALDLMNSAEFYETVFACQIERPHPSFESLGLIGQWVTDRAPAPEAGPRLWINVQNIDETVASVRTGGGEIFEPPSPDGPRWLATIRDPARNVICIVQRV